jgi:tetratricopeptide (TPR) repeat protein
MLSRAESTNQRGRLYQRLIRLWSRHGLSSEVLQYAEMYVANFPRGKHGPEILDLAAETLLENEKPEQALEYLLDSSRPLSRELDVLTAKALYRVGGYERMDRYLERARVPQSPLPPGIRFAWGQAKANLGQSEQALAMFRALGGGNSRYRDPALYRAAELLADLGRPQEAIKTYRQLAEKGKGTLWAELGREGRFLAEYAQMLPDKD